MKKILSHADLLITRLEMIEHTMDEFIDMSEVGHTDIEQVRRDLAKGMLYFPPDHYWKACTENHIRIQSDLKQRYSEWKELFDLLFQNAPESIVREIKEVHEFILSWIERNNHMAGIEPTLEENKRLFRDKTEIFHRLINSLSHTENSEIVLIPDTNSLIICPEPQKYTELIDSRRFTIVFIPTVLQELDDLKQTNRNRDDFRKKIDSVITRIKGYRRQGDLLVGVSCHNTITVKSIAKEPNFKNTLHWLDATRNDDRIIATVLEVQREHLASNVVLVTNDINLQNKADMARIPSLEPPKNKDGDSSHS